MYRPIRNAPAEEFLCLPLRALTGPWSFDTLQAVNEHHSAPNGPRALLVSILRGPFFLPAEFASSSPDAKRYKLRLTGMALLNLTLANLRPFVLLAFIVALILLLVMRRWRR